MKWKSSFWREKVDFSKTPGNKVYLFFWRKKRRLHIYPGLNTRVDFLAKKSRPHRKTGLWSENRVFGGKNSTSLIHRGIKFSWILRDKTTFAHIPGSKYECRLFCKKKVDLIENRAMKWKSSFWRKKVDFLKTPGIKVYLTFWRKKRRLYIYPGLNTRVDFLAKKGRPHRKTGL